MMTAEMKERAVAVARDVLERLDADELRITNAGNYLAGDLPADVRWAADADLRDLLPAVEEHCDVCFLGACLLSKARVYDAVPMAEVDVDDRCAYWERAPGRVRLNRNRVVRLLGDVLDAAQADLVEAAFECRDSLGGTASLELRCGAAVFGLAYPDARSRARAVAANMVAHGGVFTVAPLTLEEHKSAILALDRGAAGTTPV